MAVIEKGLNHITPKPLQTAKIIAEICEAWDQIAGVIPDVYICNWPSNEVAVKQHINYQVRIALQNCQITPTVGVMTTPKAQWQLEWVHKHLYISGADKVANTPTFFFIMLAHREALVRMNSEDFSLAVSNNNVSKAPEKVVKQLLGNPLLQELSPQQLDLPYLMGIYIVHKNKMCWLTNADGSFVHQNHFQKDLFLIQKKNNNLEAEWKPLHHSSVKATRMDPTKVIELNNFINRNTYVRLGNRVWRQVRGIPMGFSCSPLWCKLYLFYFKYNFLTQLACLGQYDLLCLFEHISKYMDDLVSMNNLMILHFFDPD
ncbi:hypothetical protein SELMODRAFT_410611 [Selaginella moellendorffii]|uniref:Reverse transcriptase domain-containing protein n=1 Tax=Selaginella moellendorffii TaxID=88036 RepID=D8RFA4_SELML|nr:hypothetical protein SELMODRAFT_410611 [Selaginella moellendorffii]